MSAVVENPRAITGDNKAPDYAKQVSDRLADEYAYMESAVVEILNEARDLPAEVTDDDIQGRYASNIKRQRDLDARIESLRVAEKEPFLRGGNAVQNFFMGMRGRLFRQNKSDKAGAADVLQARVNAYVQKKADEERHRRQEEERIAREAEDRARREREEQERLAREAEHRAARARKEENAAAAAAEAAQREAEAKRLRDEEERLRAERQAKQADAAAKTADLVRTRTDEGHMVTAKQVPYVEITDEMELDAKLLWPFVKSEHKLQALKAWAKITQHKQKMAGAIIEMRDEAVIR